jgi:hypothetical protein
VRETVRAHALAPTGDVTEIPLERAFETARHTAPVVVAGALTELGWLERVTDAFLAEVASLATPAAAADLRSRGVQHVHEHLAPDGVARLIAQLDARLRASAGSLAADVMRITAPHLGRRYYVGLRVFVRAQVPFRMLADHPDLAAAPHLAGHLRPADRHRDVDLTHPAGSTSIWAAVGPIRSGNSIEVVVDEHRPPVVPVLDPGDVLLFPADSWHASVVNHTHETRVGIGVRVVATTRLRYGPGDYWRPYADARLLDTPCAPLATVRSRCTAAAFRRWRFRRRWERAQRAAGRTELPSLKR